MYIYRILLMDKCRAVRFSQDLWHLHSASFKSEATECFSCWQSAGQPVYIFICVEWDMILEYGLQDSMLLFILECFKDE